MKLLKTGERLRQEPVYHVTKTWPETKLTHLTHNGGNCQVGLDSCYQIVLSQKYCYVCHHFFVGIFNFVKKEEGSLKIRIVRKGETSPILPYSDLEIDTKYSADKQVLIFRLSGEEDVIICCASCYLCQLVASNWYSLINSFLLKQDFSFFKLKLYNQFLKLYR